MPTGSPPTRLVFVALVLAMAALLVYAVTQAVPPARNGRRTRRPALAGLLLLAYIAIPGALAARGVLDRYNPLPAPALLLFALLTIATIALAFSSLGTGLIARFSLASLVGYQVFRLPVELLLHRLAAEGVIPEVMTYSGRSLDIVTALTALVMAVYLRGGRYAARTVHLWNVLGLVLLVNIVTIAVLATPVPFRRFTEGPPNLLPSTFPYVWLPSFLVQAALFGHLVVFRALRAGRGVRVPSPGETATP